MLYVCLMCAYFWACGYLTKFVKEVKFNKYIKGPRSLVETGSLIGKIDESYRTM